MIMNEMTVKLQTVIENEARSCSMDFGCVSPLYVYRMWGGTVDLGDFQYAMKQIDVYDYRLSI